MYRVWTDGQHLTIERTDGKPIRCGWDRLQAIKNQVLGVDVYAIEIFPAEHAVVNEINRRHFWVVPPDTVRQWDMSKRGMS